jgi:hypothetical protein
VKPCRSRGNGQPSTEIKVSKWHIYEAIVTKPQEKYKPILLLRSAGYECSGFCPGLLECLHFFQSNSLFHGQNQYFFCRVVVGADQQGQNTECYVVPLNEVSCALLPFPIALSLF